MCVELVITQGTEFEALLMQQEWAIKNELFAFLWDSNSPNQAYYRYRIWELAKKIKKDETNECDKVTIFEGADRWVKPPNMPEFEFASTARDLYAFYKCFETIEVDHEDGMERTYNRGGAPPPDFLTLKCLNPLMKFQLIWLLAGFPRKTSLVLKGDVAAVTTFAMDVAEDGLKEVVEIMINNVERPYSWTGANHLPDNNTMQDGGVKPNDDHESKLVALWCISDLICAVQEGITGLSVSAYRYRQAFEVALCKRKTFSKLARADREYNWGLISSNKWKSSVGVVLDNWTARRALSQQAIDQLRHDFANPLTAEQEKAKKDGEEKKEQDRKTKIGQDNHLGKGGHRLKNVLGEKKQKEKMGKFSVENSQYLGAV